MEKTITTTEAARHLGDVIARVKHTGETVLLTKSSEPVARLVSARPAGQATGGEIMRALASLPHDAEFADDLEAVNQADQMLTNPWD
jgi:prevent-host-death family protein